MGAVFRADKQLLKFQTNYYREEQKRREKIMDEAAERGLFLEDESFELFPVNYMKVIFMSTYIFIYQCRWFISINT